MKLQDWLDLMAMSHTAFGKLVGHEKSTIGKYTGGERMPPPKTLRAIKLITKGAVTADDFVDVVLTAQGQRVRVRHHGRMPGPKRPDPQEIARRRVKRASLPEEIRPRRRKPVAEKPPREVELAPEDEAPDSPEPAAPDSLESAVRDSPPVPAPEPAPEPQPEPIAAQPAPEPAPERAPERAEAAE